MFPTHIKKYNTPSFSDESELFLKRLFKQIQSQSSLSSSLPPSPVLMPTATSHPSLEEKECFPVGTHFENIESLIQESIRDIPNKISYSSSFSIQHRTFHVYFTVSNSPSSVTKEIETALFNMYRWLIIATHYSEQAICSQTLNIYIYWTDLKKHLPKKKREPIHWEHANTAFTFACHLPGESSTGTNEINIYRKEEWFKVFIHETFHSFALDFSILTNASQLSDQWIRQQLFRIDTEDMRFYEAYTETWAEIISLLFMVAATTTTAEFTVETFQKILSVELCWSTFQCVKVLRHYDLDYTSLLALKKITNKYKENTPAFSYFIIKCICILNIDRFIQWTMKQNHGSLCFKKTARNVQHFAHALKEWSDDETTTEKIIKIQNWMESKSFPQEIQNTLRMTYS